MGILVGGKVIQNFWGKEAKLKTTPSRVMMQDKLPTIVCIRL